MTKIPCFTIILYICLVLYSLQNALNYALFQLLAVAIFGKTHIFQKNIGGFITVERYAIPRMPFRYNSTISVF